MTNAEHIFLWVMGSGDLYARLNKIRSFTTIAKAQAVIAIGSEAIRQMVRGGEIQVGEYSAVDLCEAAKELCQWQGPE